MNSHRIERTVASSFTPPHLMCRTLEDSPERYSGFAIEFGNKLHESMEANNLLESHQTLLYETSSFITTTAKLSTYISLLS